MRHALRNAGRFASTQQKRKTQSREGSQGSLPHTFKEGKGKGDGGNTRPNGRESSGASPSN